ncbi:unnamed protein product [Kuraishia capsulata CBS 1993]|uniref:Mitochondrial import inner membrane translocase subunit TIM16 n=1 Tax=Kuraishia capsulata CBS 1993 TaxID=1382522 RepID=W6MQS1_9ASCO|nr:uncharacterized protein KUCA_T00003586001 [Kuraishia capsulata CBS 1993]CDK27607.1 unnamed protein product [Kuraishia capsulata CBS 1993]
MTKLSPKKVEEKYNYLFDINAKEKGGSLYLQSKVFRAMERLKAEFKAAEETKAAGAGAGEAGGSGAASPN